MLRVIAALAISALVTPAARAQQEPVFDNHVHLHDGAASLEAYRAQVRASGRSVTRFAAMWFGGGNQAPAGKPEAIRASNDALIALAASNPDVVPVATVHPYDGAAAVAELERVAGRGVRMLKIHPHTQRFDASDARVLTLMRRAGELGMVVMFDNANIVPGDSEKLFNLALAVPHTHFIFAHMGGLNFRFWNILKAARTADNLVGDNIHFDISAMVALVAGSPVEDEFVWTIRNVGVENVLLGSDYPQYSLADNLAALDRLSLTPEEKAKIRYGNAERILKLPPAR